MSINQLNLDPGIVKAIQICGYKNLTPIQEKSIPEILNGKDLVASAQTGTGKTAAFVLPALQRLSAQNGVRKPRVLILTPTRELATQITGAAGRYGKFLRFNMASLVGGMSYRQQLRDLSRAVDLIVATPGRLLDHMENRRLDLSGIEMLVLDEADRMLDMGFIDDVQVIAKATPFKRQTLLFSATVDPKLKNIIQSLLKDPVRIDLSQEKVASPLIKQELYLADNPKHRDKLLAHILENQSIYKAIIFSATKIGAEKLAAHLQDQGYSAAPLHGDLKQSIRNRTIDQLRRGNVQFVVATDVAARGIDIADMTHVINYDLPRFCEDYVHRIGRTGRAGKTGVAISFAMPNEARHVQRIERYIGSSLPKEMIEGLEPVTKHLNPNPPKSKKGGGRSRGGKPGYGAKSDRGDFGRRDRSRFADKGDRKEFGRDKPKFAGRSDRAESSSRGDKPRFADKGDRAESGSRRDKPRFADRADRNESASRRDKPRFADKADRSESGGRRDRSRFADKGDRKEFGRDKPKFAGRSDRAESSSRGDKPRFSDKPARAESGRGKSRFADKAESGRDKPKFGKSKDFGSRGDKKPKFAGKSDGSRFADKKRRK